MPQMVLIREISSTTFLHFSTKNESFCLRDYSGSASAPPIEVMRQNPSEGKTASYMENLARKPGNMLLNARGDVKWEDSQFWHGHVVALNRQHISAVPQPPTPKPSSGETVDISIEIKKDGITVGVIKTSRSGVLWFPRGQSSGHRLSWAKLEELARLHGEPVGV
jgi:hypothetical protein